MSLEPHFATWNIPLNILHLFVGHVFVYLV